MGVQAEMGEDRVAALAGDLEAAGVAGASRSDAPRGLCRAARRVRNLRRSLRMVGCSVSDALTPRPYKNHVRRGRAGADRLSSELTAHAEAQRMEQRNRNLRAYGEWLITHRLTSGVFATSSARPEGDE